MKIPSSPIIRIIQFINHIKLLEITINTGFLKRRKGLMTQTLVKVFTFGLLDIPNPSLNEIASKCEEIQPGLAITKVAIYKRLEKASLLLQQVFLDAM